MENNFLLFAGFSSSNEDFVSDFYKSEKILGHKAIILGNSHIGVFYENEEIAKKGAEGLKSISTIDKIEILGDGKKVFFFKRDN